MICRLLQQRMPKQVDDVGTPLNDTFSHRKLTKQMQRDMTTFLCETAFNDQNALHELPVF